MTYEHAPLQNMKLRPISTRPQTSGDVNLAFDIETDGIDSSCIHCIVTQDIDTGLVTEYNDQATPNYSVVNGVNDLEVATNIISHNGIMFDVPQIQKHFSFFKGRARHWDTLILSRYFHPNLLEIDLRRKWTMMPARLYGSHSLEAYGYRLRCFKDGFGKTTDWQEWSPEMQDYCKKDVAILVKLWTHFQKSIQALS